MEHPAAGVLLYEESIVDPWCGAVLIGQRTVITAAHCVKERSVSDLQFTFDEQRTPEARTVRAVALHPRYEATGDLRSNLAVLTLHDTVDEREPAQVGSDMSVAPSLMTSLFVVRGDAFGSSMVEGALVDGPEGMISVRFPAGSVACHGENGTGLFSGDRLVGVGSGGFAAEPTNEFGCFDVLTFAPVADQIDAML